MLKRFQVCDLPLSGLKRVERQRLGDSRGFLSRIFCAEELAAAGWNKPIAQINHTYTKRRGAVRGVHYQRPPHAEIKLVTCLRGEVWDVAVDVRQGSPTHLFWHAEHLRADGNAAFLIPEGFAHAFQALTDDVELLYLHSAAHNPNFEAGLNPQDPCLAIDWPLSITELSDRDARHPMLEDSILLDGSP